MNRIRYVLGVALLVVLLLNGCERPKQPIIELESMERPQYLQGANEEDSLRIAIASITSPRDSIVFYEELIDRLGEQLGMPVTIVQRRTYGEINDLLGQGQVDLAFICTLSYILTAKAYGVEIVAAPIISGAMEYQSLIIAASDTAAQSLFDLRGGTFAFTDPLSTSGRLYPSYYVQQHWRIPIEDFFAERIFTYGHDNSIRAVAQGLVDAAAVHSMVYDIATGSDADLAQQVQVLHASPTFTIQPIAAARHLPPNLLTDIRRFFLEMSMTEWGQHILASLGFDAFGVPSDADYDSIRALMAGDNR